MPETEGQEQEFHKWHMKLYNSSKYEALMDGAHNLDVNLKLKGCVKEEITELMIDTQSCKNEGAITSLYLHPCLPPRTLFILRRKLFHHGQMKRW